MCKIPDSIPNFIIAALLAAVAMITACADDPSVTETDDFKAKIRRDHPRIFFNAETLPSVRARAFNEEAELFSEIKARTDHIDPSTLESDDYGIPAAEAAFVYLVTEDEQYMQLAKTLLEKSLAYYHERYAEKKTVNWFAWTRQNAFAAYDWIYNSLSDEDRTRIAVSILDAVEQVQPTDSRPYFMPQENWSGPMTGFYGNRSLLWYAGLAAYETGADDVRAEEFLEEGYDLHMQVLKHRRYCAGDDGGSASTAMNYACWAYPWSEHNFIHTYLSSTGENLAPEWPHVSYFTGYLFWNMLPGLRHFGVGDAYHDTNELALTTMRCHLEQIVHFYGETMPKNAAFGKWLIEQMPETDYGRFPYAPILLTNRHEELSPLLPAEVMPFARHFNNMGQVFMRSGSGPDDTYALFMAGGVLEQHKHWDNNHFAIFKKGFLALDTGSRPDGQHTQHYYPRTIAHNCILIHMPGEELPIFVDKGAGGGQRWGAPAPGEEERPIPNDGGQDMLIGSHVAAFETHDDYSYVAGDATESYNEAKCRLALRQFVFLNPDYFVVFDRVISTQPEFKKTWLIHTATEPDIDRGIFTATHDGGRLYSRTLLPENAEIGKIGGPGKQFWSDGYNYSFPDGNDLPDTTPLLGQWRVEVSPSQPEEETFFLHLIQVGEIGLPEMVRSELVKRDGRVGVRFERDGKEWEVLFGTEGDPSGHINIRDGDGIIVERELIQGVDHQEGLFGTE